MFTIGLIKKLTPKKKHEIRLSLSIEFVPSIILSIVNYYSYDGKVYTIINSIAVLLFIWFILSFIYYLIFPKKTKRNLKIRNTYKTCVLVIFSIIIYLFISELITGKEYPLDVITNKHKKDNSIQNVILPDTNTIKYNNGFVIELKQQNIIIDNNDSEKKTNFKLSYDNTGAIHKIDTNDSKSIDSLIKDNTIGNFVLYDTLKSGDTLNLFSIDTTINKITYHDNIWFIIRRYVTNFINSVFDFICSFFEEKKNDKPPVEYFCDTIVQKRKQPIIDNNTIFYVKYGSIRKIKKCKSIKPPKSNVIDDGNLYNKRGRRDNDTMENGTINSIGSSGKITKNRFIGQIGKIGENVLARIKGISGQEGKTGTTGTSNINVATGNTGSDGVSGQKEKTINMGTNEILGKTGETGTMGKLGIAGITGILGTTGKNENTGKGGITGSSGSTGVSGNNTGIGTIGPIGIIVPTVKEFLYKITKKDTYPIIFVGIEVTNYKLILEFISDTIVSTSIISHSGLIEYNIKTDGTYIFIRSNINEKVLEKIKLIAYKEYFLLKLEVKGQSYKVKLED